MNLEQQLKLQAFLDGELPDSEAREILAWAQHDTAAAALLAELKNTRQALAGAAPQMKVPESREFYWSKIAREVQRQEPRATTAPDVSIFAALRRFLLPASAVAVLVIAGLFAHFDTQRLGLESVADADTPTVETAMGDSDAAIYRDAGEGTTLVWFSSGADDSPAQNKRPTAIN